MKCVKRGILDKLYKTPRLWSIGQKFLIDENDLILNFICPAGSVSLAGKCTAPAAECPGILKSQRYAGAEDLDVFMLVMS